MGITQKWKKLLFLHCVFHLFNATNLVLFFWDPCPLTTLTTLTILTIPTTLN